MTKSEIHYGTFILTLTIKDYYLFLSKPKKIMSLTHVIIGAVIILLGILVFISLPKIKLFFIRLRKTKYSFKYITTYKRYYNKSPFPYCVKDEFEYHILPFAEHEKDAVIYKTSTDIIFGNVPFFRTYAQVRKDKGVPDCFNAYQIAGIDIKVAGYRDSYFGTSTQVLFFFLDNVFFMGELLFKWPKGRNIDEIFKVLANKYTTDAIKGGKRFYIKKTEAEVMFFRDSGFSLVLAYVNLDNQEINSKVEAVYNQFKIKGEPIEKTNVISTSDTL